MSRVARDWEESAIGSVDLSDVEFPLERSFDGSGSLHTERGRRESTDTARRPFRLWISGVPSL